MFQFSDGEFWEPIATSLKATEDVEKILIVLSL